MIPDKPVRKPRSVRGESDRVVTEEEKLFSETYRGLTAKPVLFEIEVRHTIPIHSGGTASAHIAAFTAIANQHGDGEYRFTLPGADPDTFTKVTVEWECNS